MRPGVSWSVILIAGLVVACQKRPVEPRQRGGFATGTSARPETAERGEPGESPRQSADDEERVVEIVPDPAPSPAPDSTPDDEPEAYAEPPPPSDAALERDIRTRLVRDPLTTGKGIEVDVAATIVTLTGRVDNLGVAQAAEEIAAGVPGVGFVYNSLRLGPPPPERAPPAPGEASDDVIENRIQARLGLDPRDPTPDALDVEVEDGVATITGTVRSPVLQAFFISEAYEAGAVRVVDQMRLVPLTIDPSGRSLD